MDSGSKTSAGVSEFERRILNNIKTDDAMKISTFYKVKSGFNTSLKNLTGKTKRPIAD
jgi:hypothetical protein